MGGGWGEGRVREVGGGRGCLLREAGGRGGGRERRCVSLTRSSIDTLHVQMYTRTHTHTRIQRRHTQVMHTHTAWTHTHR